MRGGFDWRGQQWSWREVDGVDVYLGGRLDKDLCRTGSEGRGRRMKDTRRTVMTSPSPHSLQLRCSFPRIGRPRIGPHVPVLRDWRALYHLARQWGF